MKKTVAIVLAAGRGTRMKSKLPKVLHEMLGRPIILYVLDAVKAAGIKDVITVVGHGASLLTEHVCHTKVVVQGELRGSGDAVRRTAKALKGFTGDCLVICGDTPLIRGESIRALLAQHTKSGAAVTLMTARVKDPTGYGRIVRDAEGRLVRIVEELDASIYEKVIDEINIGTYCFRAADLFAALAKVTAQNAKNELYLTDCIDILHREGKSISSFLLDDPGEMAGINTRVDLAHATALYRRRLLERLMLSGVTVEDPATTTVYPGARVGKDTVIRPHTYIQSDVVIGTGCSIGPFARLRPGVRIGNNVEVGNFVELTRTALGDNTKVKHHTYLGDTAVGADANIGAGTITANYDGKAKNRTVISDRAFIGVGAILIAPVRIGRGAVVGAGCVVPKNHHVPKGATVVGVPARVMRHTTKHTRTHTGK